jgi:hypothetical protein
VGAEPVIYITLVFNVLLQLHLRRAVCPAPADRQRRITYVGEQTVQFWQKKRKLRQLVKIQFLDDRHDVLAAIAEREKV